MTQPWWLTDTYDRDIEIPQEFENLSGPKGVALVKLWSTGKTSRGWGLKTKDGSDGFMPRYMRGEFVPKWILHGYQYDRWAFAFIMRSVRMVAIDIDGKNGGIEHAEILLRDAPPTLAETSKSGNGYHLFYSVPDEGWDTDTGFGEKYGDHIGIVQGVDIRATGCVYHHKTQRWNGHVIRALPKDLRDLLTSKQARRGQAPAVIERALATGDDMEVLIMQDQLISELNAPIPPGRRNNTLFAIGSKMKLAEVPDWENRVYQRALDVGLYSGEAQKLIDNITNYA